MVLHNTIIRTGTTNIKTGLRERPEIAVRRKTAACCAPTKRAKQTPARRSRLTDNGARCCANTTSSGANRQTGIPHTPASGRNTPMRRRPTRANGCCAFPARAGFEHPWPKLIPQHSSAPPIWPPANSHSSCAAMATNGWSQQRTNDCWRLTLSETYGPTICSTPKVNSGRRSKA